ncbi:MAG: hypothetical protein E7183_07625 [Erysipelotrichaceae bacterium]|nr:hypothetical protein [Erysipelotrichaceae bacterium]
MKKSLFIFAFLFLCFISSCKESSIKIVNMEEKNGEYYLTVDKIVNFITITDYVETSQTYIIETIPNDLKIIASSIYLEDGENIIIIKQDDKEFILHFFKEYDVTVELVDKNNNCLYQFETLINTSLSYDEIISNISIPEGYEWDGSVIYNDEVKYIDEITVLLSVKLTVIFKPINYKITINDNLGFNNEYILDVETGKILEFNIPNVEGYKFLGVYANDTLIEEGSVYSPKMGTKFTIYYEPLSFKITYLYNNEEKVVDVLYDGVIEKFIPDKKGYAFVYWELNKEEFSDIVYNYTNDIILTAKFEPLSFKITYLYNNEEKVVDVLYDGVIEEFIPDKKGYTFVYWELNKEEFSDIVYNYTNDITLNGIFKPNIYKITYQNIDTPYSYEVSYGSEFILPIPEKEGFEFLGWYLGDAKIENGKYNYDYDIVLKAKWKDLGVKLNLETFGGYVDEEALIESDGTIILPIPEKEEFTFIGWYYDINYQNKASVVLSSEYNNEVLYAKYYHNDDYYVDSFVISKFNEHISTYDVLTMFDSSQTGFTSKYWHKIGVSFSGNNYYVSGIAKNGEALSSLNSYDFVILAYSSYGLYSQFEKMEINIGTKVLFSADPSTIEENDVNLLVSFINSDTSEYYDEISDYLDSVYSKYNEIEQNITLINNYNNIPIIWESSHNDIISCTGVFRKPVSNVSITLTAYVNNEKIYEFTVTAKGDGKSNALATGYIYTPYNTITQNAMNVLDIIYCAFLDIDANGDFTNESRMISNINNYIKPLAKNSGTKIVISVNQSASGAFASVAASPTLREKLATNILNFVEKLEIDGIDIDWETPTSSEATTFTLLMEAIYNKMKAKNPEYLVTAAIGGGKWQPPKYDLTNSKAYLDYVNLMTYSMATGNGYYQNALYKSTKGATLTSCTIVESVDIFNGYGIENAKILVGIPFYLTVQTESGGPGSKTGSGKSKWYNLLDTTYALSDTMKEYFDEECGVPYRYDSVNKIFISYENEKSIKRKCEYINANGLAGIMYWQYGQDVDDYLSNAIGKYINA